MLVPHANVSLKPPVAHEQLFEIHRFRLVHCIHQHVVVADVFEVYFIGVLELEELAQRFCVLALFILLQFARLLLLKLFFNPPLHFLRNHLLLAVARGIQARGRLLQSSFFLSKCGSLAFERFHSMLQLELVLDAAYPLHCKLFTLLLHIAFHFLELLLNHLLRFHL